MRSASESDPVRFRSRMRKMRSSAFLNFVVICLVDRSQRGPRGQSTALCAELSTCFTFLSQQAEHQMPIWTCLQFLTSCLITSRTEVCSSFQSIGSSTLSLLFPTITTGTSLQTWFIIGIQCSFSRIIDSSEETSYTSKMRSLALISAGRSVDSPVSTISVKMSLEYAHISGGRTTFLWTLGTSEVRSEMMAQTREVLPTPGSPTTTIRITLLFIAIIIITNKPQQHPPLPKMGYMINQEIRVQFRFDYNRQDGSRRESASCSQAHL